MVRPPPCPGPYEDETGPRGGHDAKFETFLVAAPRAPYRGSLMSESLPRLEGPGDAELISAVRAGDVDAYGRLFSRHVGAARRLARQLVAPGDADDLVSEAFAKVLAVLQRGGGPDVAFRAYLLTAVRRLHVDRLRAASHLHTTDDLTPFDDGVPFRDTTLEAFDTAAAARAFASLPERWQMVLWHTEVEGQRPAEVALLLGISPGSVSALAYRAREGLRQAFVSMHAPPDDDRPVCAWTRRHLGAYLRQGLSRRDRRRVEEHLRDCRPCAAVHLELSEENSRLAGLIGPAVLGGAAAAYVGGAGATGAGGLGAGALLGSAAGPGRGLRARPHDHGAGGGGDRRDGGGRRGRGRRPPGAEGPRGVHGHRPGPGAAARARPRTSTTWWGRSRGHATATRVPAPWARPGRARPPVGSRTSPARRARRRREVAPPPRRRAGPRRLPHHRRRPPPRRPPPGAAPDPLRHRPPRRRPPTRHHRIPNRRALPRRPPARPLQHARPRPRPRPRLRPGPPPPGSPARPPLRLRARRRRRPTAPVPALRPRGRTPVTRPPGTSGACRPPAEVAGPSTGSCRNGA